MRFGIFVAPSLTEPLLTGSVCLQVFDLADRNMWLRRQIVTVLRQIIKSMFGDIVNKKIVDYMATFTAPLAVAGYLNNIKEVFWPGGSLAAPSPQRDENTK